MKTKKNFYLSFFLALIFFGLAFFTLPDYGVSWDETLHFSRGQVYLNYFLTGKKDYVDFPGVRRSFYQIDYQAGEFWFNGDPGHPPVSGTLAAISNFIFYRVLGVLEDIQAYHVFNIAISTFLVFVTTYFALSTLGYFASFIAYLSLVLYPLFWSEAHFNVKDPSQTAFFAATIFLFYKSLEKFSSRWLLITFVFFGLGLGTKFNIIFLPFIFIPYIICRFWTKRSEVLRSIPKSYRIALVSGVVLSAGIFFVSWPYLWSGPLEKIISVFEYYKNIGAGTSYQPQSFYIKGFNTFALQWILFTTPPVTLILTFFGVIAVWLSRNVKNNVGLLWLIWLVVPIARVTIPGTSIYGGVRQILEFLPAMALLAGLGGKFLLNRFKIYDLRLKIAFCILIFAFLISPLVRLHPNENVYFNSLIGGLSGAKAANFPSWGNSYGNAYLSGIAWLNGNAQEGSRVALIQGTEPNAPAILLRPDIYLENANWSGIERQGEYLMELVFNDTGKAFYYSWEYVDKFLEPVYELKVDGVSILKIWKNDLENTKEGYKFKESLYPRQVSLEQQENNLTVNFREKVLLSRVKLDFKYIGDCFPITETFVDTSLDKKNWLREKDWIPFPQVGQKNNLQDDSIEFFLPARKAKFVRFWFDNESSCGLNKPSVKIYTLDN